MLAGPACTRFCMEGVRVRLCQPVDPVGSAPLRRVGAQQFRKDGDA